VSPDGHVNTFAVPRRLETNEIPDIVNDFRIAAGNAIKAGTRNYPEVLKFFRFRSPVVVTL
jgi:hypothetical protein